MDIMCSSWYWAVYCWQTRPRPGPGPCQLSQFIRNNVGITHNIIQTGATCWSSPSLGRDNALSVTSSIVSPPPGDNKMVSGEHGKNICYNLNLHISCYCCKAPLLCRDCWRRLVYYDETLLVKTPITPCLHQCGKIKIP